MDSKFLTYISLFGLVVQLVYGIRGIVVPNSYPDASVAIRLYFLAPIFLTAFLILLFIKRYTRDFQLFSIISVVLVLALTLTQLVYGLIDSSNLFNIYFLGFPLVFFGVALFSGLPFFWHLIYLPLVLAVAIVIALLKIPTSLAMELSIVNIIALVMALAAAYFIELRNRQLYMNKIQIASKSEFKATLLSVLAHDVRRPLGNLGSILKLAKAGHLTDEERNSLIDKLSTDFDKISSMTEDILTWIKSQFEGRYIKNQHFDAYEMAEEIISIESTEAGKKGIELRNQVTRNVNIYSDPAIVKIILRNVITNSIKFCQRGDHVEVAVEESDQQMHFVVKDTGPGFHGLTNEADPVLESTSGTQGEKGFGIGLRMCQDLLRLVDSSLEIKNCNDRGTTVSFSFRKV